MRILVENHGEGPDIRLHIPAGLLLNRLGAAIGAQFLSQHEVSCTAAQLRLLFAQLRRIRKDFPHLPLVELESSDGSRVRILL